MITVNILKFDKALSFQVIEQKPEVQQYLKSIGGTFVASNGWYITASKVPELNVQDHTIFVRGKDSTQDLRVDRTWDLESNNFRDKVINKVESAVNEFNAAVVDASQPVTFIAMDTPPFKLSKIIVGVADLSRSSNSVNVNDKPIVNR